MPIRIKPYGQEHISAVKRFNGRLATGGSSARFPESCHPQWLPKEGSFPLYQSYFVATDGEDVRGGYILKQQAFYLDGESTNLADFQLPISEGVVDRRFSLVGMQLLNDAANRQPFLFGLGMGSLNTPIARLLKSMNFSTAACPFYFKINKPVRFLRGVPFLRRKWLYRLACDAAAFSGVGSIGIQAIQSIRNGVKAIERDSSCERFDQFERWADAIWDEAKSSYLLIADRTSEVLNRLYPPEDTRFIKLMVSRDQKPVGWVVVLNTRLKQHKYFGDLQVGTIVDGLSVAGEEGSLIAQTDLFLARAEADLTISNQMHRRWTDGCRSAGFIEGPSNYFFAASKALTERLSPLETRSDQIHLTRGDGDGPVGL